MTVDLSHLETDFGAAEEKKAGNFDPVPDGKYVVEVDAAEVTTSKSGAPMLKWTLRILEGPFDNRLMWRYNHLASKSNLEWLKTDLGRAGITLAKLNDLNERAGELVGLVLNVTKKTNGQYENTYIDGIAAATDAPANDSGLKDDPSSALPF
jgi:hypothetical protein